MCLQVCVRETLASSTYSSTYVAIKMINKESKSYADLPQSEMLHTRAQAETFSPTPIHKILTLITLHIVFAVSQGVWRGLIAQSINF